jgi:hypothetical protein
MHQSDRGIDAQIALSDLADLLNAASVPEHLKRQPNLAFLTQEQLAERWGLSIDTLRDYRSRGGGPVFFGGRIRGREVKYPIDAILDYENKNRIEFNGEEIVRR